MKNRIHLLHFTTRFLCFGLPKFSNASVGIFPFQAIKNRRASRGVSRSEKLDRKVNKTDDKRIMNARKVSYRGKQWIDLPEEVFFFFAISLLAISPFSLWLPVSFRFLSFFAPSEERGISLPFLPPCLSHFLCCSGVFPFALDCSFLTTIELGLWKQKSAIQSGWIRER